MRTPKLLKAFKIILSKTIKLSKILMHQTKSKTFPILILQKKSFEYQCQIRFMHTATSENFAITKNRSRE